MTTIYIVRHAESTYNSLPKEDMYKLGMWGKKGAPLTENGEKQAKKRAEELRNIYFDAIFSSDVTRAEKTAEILKLERKIAIQTTNVLRERLSYIIPGKTFKETAEEIQNELKDLDDKAKLAYKPDNQEDMRNESADETATRMFTFLREIAVAYRNKTVLVINHENNILALLLHLGYGSYDELPSGSVQNTGYIILQSDGVDFFIKETQGVSKIHAN